MMHSCVATYTCAWLSYVAEYFGSLHVANNYVDCNIIMQVVYTFHENFMLCRIMHRICVLCINVQYYFHIDYHDDESSIS